jgi:hypothetical protein
MEHEREQHPGIYGLVQSSGCLYQPYKDGRKMEGWTSYMYPNAVTFLLYFGPKRTRVSRWLPSGSRYGPRDLPKETSPHIWVIPWSYNTYRYFSTNECIWNPRDWLKQDGLLETCVWLFWTTYTAVAKPRGLPIVQLQPAIDWFLA